MKKNSHHFEQEVGTFACGECSVRSILSMYGMELKIRLNTSDGLTKERIREILKNHGITTLFKNTTWNNIKARSIVYYPRYDHWVTVEKKTKNKIYINNSDKVSGEWLSKDDFINNWVVSGNVGFIIVCKKQKQSVVFLKKLIDLLRGKR